MTASDTPGDGPDRRPVARKTLLIRGGLLAVVGALLAATLAIVSAYKPSDYDFYPKCMSWTVLGIHCPGCGLTRAAHSLLHLDIPQTLAWNPLALFVLPYLGAALLRSLWFWLWDVRSARSMVPERLGWFIVGVMVVFWVLRNVPYEPFTMLAPHDIRG